MQFSVPLIAMLASLGMAAPGNSPTPETFQVDLPTLNGDLGYLISPAEKPETNNTIVKRREGCVACQWCGGCGVNQGQCCIPVCCQLSSISKDYCLSKGWAWSTNC